MLAKLRAGNVINKDDNNVEESNNINVHEEYHMALRTKSFAEFFTKAQNLFTNKPSLFYENYIKFSEILLEPAQETIPSILNDSLILSRKPELKHLILSYFNITASASHFCTRLLKSINQVHSNHRFIRRALDFIDQYEEEKEEQQQQESSSNLELVAFELLQSFMHSKNPFLYPENFDFKTINDNNSSVLQHLKAMRKKVMRKIKYIKYTKKASRVCATLACGIVATTATILAAHTLTAIIMGPAIIMCFPNMKSFKRKLTKRIRVLRSSGFLGKVCDQLDVAAKGTYILSRDLDTTSRLVARLHNEIERNREKIRFWMERKEEKRLGLEIVKELKKSEVGLRKQVEELEEQMYLSLVTINRARALVATEI